MSTHQCRRCKTQFTMEKTKKRHQNKCTFRESKITPILKEDSFDSVSVCTDTLTSKIEFFLPNSSLKKNKISFKSAIKDDSLSNYSDFEAKNLQSKLCGKSVKKNVECFT